MNSHHLKIQESIYDRLFLLLWSIWRPAVLTLRQIIILPFDDTALPLCLRDIQVCHMKAVLFLYPLLDLLICSTLLKAGHIHVFEREFNSDILSRYISLGKLDYRLNVPGDVAMNVNGKAELIMIKFVIPNKSIN